MYDPELHSFCSAFYIVEKSIEVEVATEGESYKRIRIDVLRNDKTGEYYTKAYEEVDFTLQPTYPQTNESFDRKPEEFRVWVHYDLPFTSWNSADATLGQALDFLRERCPKE